MADGDQRIEVLEDEMKVLKGEVSRTLVDLRAILMREDSPLMSGGGLVARIAANVDAGVPAQINLAPVAVGAPPTVIAITPRAPEAPSEALASLPDLASTATPNVPGSPDEGIIHSLDSRGPAQSPDKVPLIDGPSTDNLGLPDVPSVGELNFSDAPSTGDLSLPGGPSTGDLPVSDGPSTGESTPPATGAVPGAGRDADLEDARNEDRIRKRKDRLSEEESLEEAERAIRTRKRESDQAEEAAEEEARNRRKKRDRDDAEERDKLENRTRPDLDPVAELKKAQLEDAEHEEQLLTRKARIDEEKELQASERLLSNRKKEKEQLEDQAEGVARERRRKRAQEEDEDHDDRSRRRKRDREEEEEFQALRETRRQASYEQSEQPAGRWPPRLNREHGNFERERMEMEYESELQGEIEHFRRVRHRGRELEVEMERYSDSRLSEEDSDTGLDAEAEIDQESEDIKGLLDLDPPGAEADGDYADLESDLEVILEDEADDDFAAIDEDEPAGDWDGQTEPSSPNLEPLEQDDSYEYQEEPKINGNNGNRRRKGPEEGRRAYEGPDHQDRDDYDRYQEYGRRPQYPPRSEREPRSRPNSPMRRRPPTDDYGYAANGGDRNWGGGYDQWPNPQDRAPEPPAMDLNLVSNLVRWASMAKHRVGEKRLSDIIELYAETRNAPPGLSKALTHIASIVDDQPPESGQAAQETMDLIAHLHGILTASLPVSAVPQIQGRISFGTGIGFSGGGSSGGNDNGDW